MRPIISNDNKTFYARIDYDLLERTRLSTKTLATATVLPTLNSSGFVANDFIAINDPGKEQSEIRQIDSVSGKDITITTPTTFDFDNKVNVYKVGYDLIKVYGDSTVVATMSVKTDYLSSVNVAIVSSVAYSYTFFNTTSSAETEKGEVIFETDRLLCSPADVAQYESLSTLGTKVIDKIDIATRDIRNMFRAQKQNIKSVDDRNLLRSPCGLSALHYIFTELIKSENDSSSQKAKKYNALYQSQITKALSVINVEDTNVRVMGQTIVAR